jgi:hypothetical protein
VTGCSARCLLAGNHDRRRINGAEPAAGRPIHALLAARLDQLGVHERAVVECAAVAGKVFDDGAVTELAPAAFQLQHDRTRFGGTRVHCAPLVVDV